MSSRMAVYPLRQERLRDVVELMPGELRQLRHAYGWTQVQAADWVDVAPNTWARWERLEAQPQPVMRHYLRWLYLSAMVTGAAPKPPVSVGQHKGSKLRQDALVPSRRGAGRVVVPLPKSGGSNYTPPKNRHRKKR